MAQLPVPVKDAIINAYADSLAPVFWYLIPFIASALLLAITLKQIPLFDTAGMVARGEAVGGEEAERLEAERIGGSSEGSVEGTIPGTVKGSLDGAFDGSLAADAEPEPGPVGDNDGELARRLSQDMPGFGSDQWTYGEYAQCPDARPGMSTGPNVGLRVGCPANRGVATIGGCGAPWRAAYRRLA